MGRQNNTNTNIFYRMKKLLLLLLSAMVILPMYAQNIIAYEQADTDTILVGDLYYVLNKAAKTAKVTYQDKSADNYSKLTTINILSKITVNGVSYDVTSIGERAFAFASNITYVGIANSITSIEAYAFYSCSSLSSISIPENVQSVGKYVFYNAGLTSVTWNAIRCSVPQTDGTYIYPVFLGCEKNISSVIFGEKVEKIPDNICWEMTKLNSITIPKSVKIIGESALYGCTGLSSLTIPNNVTSLEGGALSKCTSLTSMNIPNSITTISFGLFQDCKNLKEVTLPSSIKTIEAQAFLGCENLTDINIPNGVQKIGWNCFLDCNSLSSISIPQSVTDIGDYAFAYCDTLTNINVSMANENYSSLDGVLLDKKQNVVFQCPGGKQGVYVIPKTITTIAGAAFVNCKKLTIINIPSNVKTIGDGAFYMCTGLKAIFNYAMIPQALNEDVFEKVDTTSCILYVPVKSVDLYANADVWKTFDHIEPIAAEKEDGISQPVTVIPSTTSVNVTWAQVSGAEIYELIILDSKGNEICRYIFNADGQLLSINSTVAKARKVITQTQEQGFSYTITGLEEGMSYTFSITSKNAEDVVLDTQTVSFTTNSATGQEMVISCQEHGNKSIRNGQLLIERDGKTYTVQGQEVK